MEGEQQTGFAVEVVEERLVRPSSSSHEEWLALSPCDALMRDVNYTRRLLFYPHHGAAGHMLRTLRHSLSLALAHFYPLAGRLSLDQNGRLAVHCNDAGAQFVQARLRGTDAPSITQLQASRFAVQPFFSQLARWGSYSRALHEGSAPLLSIQVTTFACGGIALGVALSHVIADGTSFWHFMSSWAECAIREMPSIPPLHKRQILATCRPPSTQKPALDFFEDLQDMPTQRRDKKVGKSFCIPKDMVEKMKSETQHQYSAYEVVCAHIWKHTNRAWNHLKDTNVGFINVVNMRDRMMPPLPRGYFGNAILWSIATTTSGQLNDENLAATARRIHDAILACSSSHMHEFLELLEVYPCLTEKILQPLNCNGVRMRVSSSAKFPVSSINFGWGKPLAARSASVEENNKIAFYPDPCSHGSIVFCLALPRNIMETLEHDPSFLFYVE
ncbi:hypothetical protein GOP47_0009139 [Adiantum capillus-veneris]|uniref:Uncharacterized protein n=1 Tax=Adiantum capillus-veneris TaxID=13818 RepID=A0A9D4UZY0_ADICA|nr:hypothetical protein GOP47_0008841 [Adiantum capillus-veneris]KAI5077074.1 hypothetical protein GOP47_0009139 [Adiantum capillus-veneris]